MVKNEKFRYPIDSFNRNGHSITLFCIIGEEKKRIDLDFSQSVDTYADYIMSEWDNGRVVHYVGSESMRYITVRGSYMQLPLSQSQQKLIKLTKLEYKIKKKIAKAKGELDNGRYRHGFIGGLDWALRLLWAIEDEE